MKRPRYSQSDQSVHVSRAFVDAVAKQIIRLNRQMPWPDLDNRGKGIRGGGQSPVVIVYPAVVTSAIGQASGTSFGVGNVQLYYQTFPMDATSVLTADADNTSVPVQNWYTTSGTIATGKHCWVISAGGALWLMNWEC